MLETQARIAGKIVAVMVPQDPVHGRVWQRPMPEDGLVAPEIGVKGAGEGQQRPPRMAVAPQLLAIAQGGQVEIRVPLRTVPPQFTVVQRRGCHRQKRARGTS